MTYLAGISSISGAILAGLMTQAGLITTLSSGDGAPSDYVYVTSGLLLIVVAIAAPEGLTGLAQRAIDRAVAVVRPGSAGSTGSAGDGPASEVAAAGSPS